jgi:PAS domain S-box-containing protein
MRRWFDRLPIHRKLVASALLITAVALGIATAGLGAFDIWRHRATAEDDARALAQVLAENTAAAVLFGDVPAAEELLRSVRARTVVTRACLYLPGGQLFAGFSATGLACPGRDVDDTWGGVSGGADVVRDGRVLGTVVVERSLSDLRGRLLATAAGGALMFVVAAWSAYLLAQRVNARISRPITSLAAYARRFGADVDLAPPRIAAGPDELGDLVVAFDGMVGRIRGATEALRRETAEREAALAQVREAEHRFRTLSDGSPVLLWVNGLAGCEFVNRAYLDFVGLADDAEVRGFDWSKFVHPDDRDDYLATYQRAFDARAPFQAEFRFRRTNGAWRWMRSEATPRFEDGGFAGYVGATVDITERRVAEDALREADQRKDAFLAILAHELRNPLAPIRTGLELLKMDEGGPTVARIRPMLERQVAHMVRLIDDLLDVSRITSGKIHLQRQPTALADLVHAAVEANRAAIDGAGLTLAVRLPEAPCTLDVDPTRFVQVLSNLLHNATKFTDRGGRIEVEARFEARLGECDARPWLMLAVRDTGIGLDPATLPRVFEFFVQGDSRRRPLSGLGIGLGLARQLVEMHGGCITVASEGPGPPIRWRRSYAPSAPKWRRPTTAAPGWPAPPASPPTWCCSTSACRSSTATRPAGSCGPPTSAPARSSSRSPGGGSCTIANARSPPGSTRTSPNPPTRAHWPRCSPTRRSKRSGAFGAAGARAARSQGARSARAGGSRCALGGGARGRLPGQRQSVGQGDGEAGLAMAARGHGGDAQWEDVTFREAVVGFHTRADVNAGGDRDEAPEADGAAGEVFRVDGAVIRIEAETKRGRGVAARAGETGHDEVEERERHQLRATGVGDADPPLHRGCRGVRLQPDLCDPNLPPVDARRQHAGGDGRPRPAAVDHRPGHRSDRRFHDGPRGAAVDGGLSRDDVRARGGRDSAGVGRRRERD